MVMSPMMVWRTTWGASRSALATDHESKQQRKSVSRVTTSRKPSLVTLFASVAIPITHAIWNKHFECLQIHHQTSFIPLLYQDSRCKLETSFKHGNDTMYRESKVHHATTTTIRARLVKEKTRVSEGRRDDKGRGERGRNGKM